MMVVGCAGFAVPATRYFKEYLFVEVQETHLAVPGPGTLRRWRREAPQGFEFALLGPREIGQEGFRDGKVIETALRTLGEVAQELEARTAAPDEAELLGLAPEAPVLFATTVAIGEDGRVVDLGRTVYRADRYRFQATLMRRVHRYGGRQ